MTSEGEFYEALNTACQKRVPVLFLVEDNGYAISVPVEVQTPGGNISKLVTQFPGSARRGVRRHRSAGELRRHASAAADHCRARKGPALVHAHVTRPYSHSLSDDDKLYKTDRGARGRGAARSHSSSLDCFWCAKVFSTRKSWRALEAEVDREIIEATDRALAAELPAKESDHAMGLFAGHRSDFPAIRGRAEVLGRAEDDGRDDSGHAGGRDGARRAHRGLRRGRRRLQPRGESRSVKGKGGVFKATAGLQRRFGSERVFNSPLAEANIVGRAVGMALRGMKPVVEIQFFDYIWPAMMQIRDELVLTRWRSSGIFKAPVVIRAAIGGYLTGGGIYHSQCGEVIFTHCPGLRVVMPSTALDLCGLLRTAIRSDDPVLFLEHKHLYRQPYNRSPYPGPDFTIPFGKARVVREGTRRQHHHLRRAGASRRSGGGGAGARRHFGRNRGPAHAFALRLGGDCAQRERRPIA